MRDGYGCNYLGGQILRTFAPALTCCSLFRKNPTVRDPAPTNDKMPTFLLLDKTRAKLLAILTLQKQTRYLQMNAVLKNGQTEGQTLGLLENAGECCGYLPFFQHNSRSVTLPFKAAAAQDEMIQNLTGTSAASPTLDSKPVNNLEYLYTQAIPKVVKFYSCLNELLRNQ